MKGVENERAAQQYLACVGCANVVTQAEYSLAAAITIVLTGEGVSIIPGTASLVTPFNYFIINM